jgi:hypothetical protein
MMTTGERTRIIEPSMRRIASSWALTKLARPRNSATPFRSSCAAM